VIEYKKISVGALETNCYIIFNKEKSAIIVDPGGEGEKISLFIEEKKLKPLMIINTHGHADHCGANKFLKEKYSIPILIHEDDTQILNSLENKFIFPLVKGEPSPEPDSFLKDGDLIGLGEITLKIIHTPGHTPGSISILINGVLISGDLIFSGSVGRTDLPGGSWSKLLESIKNKILTLPEETIILPGHGPSTTVGEEKRNNPFINYEAY
jgi:glyoxylase-like metal-dependent hydrolase (beta-lactamase superfamily II)